MLAGEARGLTQTLNLTLILNLTLTLIRHVASAALAAALNCRNGLRSTPLHQVALDLLFSAYYLLLSAYLLVTA